MEESIEIISQRISELITICKNDNMYDYPKIIFEIEQLVVSITGKDSEEYRNFVNIYRSRCRNYEKMIYLIGILNALRNHLVINGFNRSKDCSWQKLLHPLVYKVSYKKFSDKYYADAVESSIKELNTRAKKLYKKYRHKELDGADLFANIFSSDKDKYLLLAGDDLDSQSGKDEQEGYRFLYMGLWKGIRNPKAHENTFLTESQSKERLIFVSMLMNKLDESIKKANLLE